MAIRQAAVADASRIAEILVFNNRVYYRPIFHDDAYSFGKLQVLRVAEEYLRGGAPLKDTLVYDDGFVKGFLTLSGREITKLYVDTFFQDEGIGGRLLEYAVAERQADCLWALEKNVRALAFYARHGFHPSGERALEEGTTEYLLFLKR